jgi:hypothetical protein
VAIVVIGLVLGKILEATGTPLPVTADQIYQTALILAGIVRVFWTSGKIKSFLPSK